MYVSTYVHTYGTQYSMKSLLNVLYEISLCIVEIKVNFSQSTYEANEHEGPAQPVLMLSKPSPCCLHVLVKTMNNTATG